MHPTYAHIFIPLAFLRPSLPELGLQSSSWCQASCGMRLKSRTNTTLTNETKHEKSVVWPWRTWARERSHRHQQIGYIQCWQRWPCIGHVLFPAVCYASANSAWKNQLETGHDLTRNLLTQPWWIKLDDGIKRCAMASLSPKEGTASSLCHVPFQHFKKSLSKQWTQGTFVWAPTPKWSSVTMILQKLNYISAI